MTSFGGNDCLKNNGSLVYTASGAAATGTEAGNYSAVIILGGTGGDIENVTLLAYASNGY